MIDTIQHNLKQQALSHLVSRESLLASRDANFKKQIARLNIKQKKFWLGGITPGSVDDLDSMPVHYNSDVLDTQEQDPPYGMTVPGQLLFMSSGSTGQPRMKHYFTWEHWHEYNITAARSLLAYNVNEGDTVMTTDVGNLQAGYRHFEDAASFICGARVIKSGQTTWEQKLDLIERHQVTVLVANATKLKRLARVSDVTQRCQSVRLIVQIGENITAEDQAVFRQAFGVNDLLNGYGCIELGQISYNCPYGYSHVHEDLLHVSHRDTYSTLTRLVGPPLFNIASEEVVRYSYKGPCACGSHLPTVDYFQPRDRVLLEKE